jgi:disulfide bond formation protein DsbB
MKVFFLAHERCLLGWVYIALFIGALILEYGFNIQGCFFCWIQRWWMFCMGLVLLMASSWRWVVCMCFLSCALGLYQVSLAVGHSTCMIWGGFLPVQVFSWLMRFPQCDLSGFWNVPWMVWLSIFQAVVMGYCLRRCIDE